MIVIGGGINGVAIARECATAGRRTLLIEQTDFGSGTTSRSTRLIHGGLRYLEHGEIGLVTESLRERKRLLRRYPHLVHPLQFLLAMNEVEQTEFAKNTNWVVALPNVGRGRHGTSAAGDVEKLEHRWIKDGDGHSSAFRTRNVNSLNAWLRNGLSRR